VSIIDDIENQVSKIDLTKVNLNDVIRAASSLAAAWPAIQQGLVSMETFGANIVKAIEGQPITQDDWDQTHALLDANSDALARAATED
jgi:hypothetical protein